MKLLNSFAVAFAMYSKIPMPNVEWDEESMKYSMCFFPLIGVVCGAALFLWLKIAGIFTFSFLLNAIVCALLPLLITGGIHLDGFCDTIDALSSHQSRERKLEILSDPHIGAFGVMGCIAILLLNVGFWAEFIMNTAGSTQLALVVCFGFVYSRALSGLAVVCLAPAKTTGTLAKFSGTAQKNTVRIVLLFFAVLSGCAMVALSPQAGCAALLASAVVFGVYRAASYKNFGGITGDLAGWFLTICETSVLAAAAIVGRFLH